eukprot:7225815-Karenia_brevis.AAC.1
MTEDKQRKRRKEETRRRGALLIQKREPTSGRWSRSWTSGPFLGGSGTSFWEQVGPVFAPEP